MECHLGATHVGLNQCWRKLAPRPSLPRRAPARRGMGAAVLSWVSAVRGRLAGCPDGMISYGITTITARGEEDAVTDILIRDVPDDVLAAIDAKARRVGLSRTEYIRRALARERDDRAPDVRVEDLVAFADAFADLAEPEVMRQAWS